MSENKKPAKREAVLERAEEILGWGGMKKDVTLLVISACALIASFTLAEGFPIDPAWIAIVLCGFPIIMADRWATRVVVIALVGAVGIYLLTGEILRGVTVLVVFCPCALVLATPTAIMAAIGNASKHGFLVKEGDALERLAKVGIIALDKTGTLTTGKLHVTSIEGLALTEAGGEQRRRRQGEHDGQTVEGGQTPFDEQEVLRLVSAAETLSEHPVGKAIVAYARSKHIAIPAVEDFEMIPGQGVKARVEGHLLAAGNTELAASELGRAELGEGELAATDLTGANPPDTIKRVQVSESDEGTTEVYVTRDGHPWARICLGDTIRPEAAQTVEQIRQTGLQTVLLTLTFSMTLNFIAIALAFAAILDPVSGALVHNCGSVAVIINSSFLLRYAHKSNARKEGAVA